MNISRSIADVENDLVVKETMINDLMANCNSLRDRCWKADARIKVLETSCCRWEEINSNLVESLRQGAKDLTQARQQIQKLESLIGIENKSIAGYVMRLEAAFLEEAANAWYSDAIITNMYVDEERLKPECREELKARAAVQAREALEALEAS